MPRIAVLTCTGTFTESVTTVAGDGASGVGVCANAEPVPVSMAITALAPHGASDRHIRCRFIMYTSL
jgi:hypothetical protein